MIGQPVATVKEVEARSVSSLATGRSSAFHHPMSAAASITISFVKEAFLRYEYS
jgi:hypothetical protein